MQDEIIRLANFAEEGICVAASDGAEAYLVIKQAIEAGHRVAISFAGVTRLTTAFLNSAIGKLYGDFSEEHLKQRLAPPLDTQPWQLSRLKITVDRAKEFFEHPDAERGTFAAVTGIDDDESN